MKKALPNLFVIGAMKAGTTSLHDYLSLHPDIFMSHTKELDFFCHDNVWKLGLDWYEDQFDGSYRVKGESSQNYTKVHQFGHCVVDRIQTVTPDAKFVYLVRDPIARAVSHFYEAVAGGYGPGERLNDCLSNVLENNHYLLTSSYHRQLVPYVERFGMDRVLVVALEDLVVSRLDTMNRIFRFLGLSDLDDDDAFDFIRNSGAHKRTQNVIGQIVSGSGAKVIRSMIPEKMRTMLRSSRYVETIVTKKIVREELSRVVKEQLCEYFKPEVTHLRELTGESFDEWSV